MRACVCVRARAFVPARTPEDALVYALDLATGAQRWTFRTQAAVSSSAALSRDGTLVYIGSNDGRVYCLVAATGALVWSHATAGAVSTPPAVGPDGTVYASSGAGTLAHAHANHLLRPSAVIVLELQCT
jgi:outer membrane protein assembly factor BamB